PVCDLGWQSHSDVEAIGGQADTHPWGAMDNLVIFDHALTAEELARVVAGGDALGDACDNCASARNPGQEDRDPPRGNGGDACADPDGDGVPDAQDNCPDTANADQHNADADTLGDACDPNADDDAFTNAQEEACGSDPLVPNALLPDGDGDGTCDGLDTC